MIVVSSTTAVCVIIIIVVVVITVVVVGGACAAAISARTGSSCGAVSCPRTGVCVRIRSSDSGARAVVGTAADRIAASVDDE